MKWKKHIHDLYRLISRWWLRKRIKNDNFTILCPNCIGGVIYHELGKQFMSPTINLWMYDKDFYRFVRNLSHYLSQKLIFVRGIDPTPTAWCDDVLIHFNHYHSEEEAATKWYNRIKRIQWDNLFIIASDMPHENELVTDEDILNLQNIPSRGKIVFAVREIPNIDYIVHLAEDTNRLSDEPPFVKAYMFDKTKILDRWRWETAWDWVHWLNTGDIKRK